MMSAGDLLYDRKWRLLRRRLWPFRFFPFVDFALAAGSMALGGVHQDSDFDIIVGARSGRLYTARFFCLAVYRLLGWRPSAMRFKIPVFSASGRIRTGRQDSRFKNTTVPVRRAADKFCFNHFVTERSYRLQPPYNRYWQELYANLTPLYGEAARIARFFKENSELISPLNRRGRSAVSIGNDLRFRGGRPGRGKLFLEWALAGRLGHWLEQCFKRYQVRKIEASFKRFPPGYRPRIVYDDREVELHLDTRRTERTIPTT